VTGEDSTNLVFTILGFHTIIVIGFHHHCWWSSYHEVFPIKASELSEQSNLQLSLPKETAFPRKSRYDKGKNKISQDLLESPSLVGPLGLLRATDGGEEITILELLTGTHLSREITVPFEENNPSVSEPFRVSFPPSPSSADVNPAKNNETQQRKGTQDRSMDRFEWKTSTGCL
jgi:hypothetical protein